MDLSYPTDQSFRNNYVELNGNYCGKQCYRDAAWARAIKDKNARIRILRMLISEQLKKATPVANADRGTVSLAICNVTPTESATIQSAIGLMSLEWAEFKGRKTKQRRIVVGVENGDGMIAGKADQLLTLFDDLNVDAYVITTPELH